MRREFPVGPHDDGRLLRRDPVHHRRDPQARGFTRPWGPEGPPLSWTWRVYPLGLSPGGPCGTPTMGSSRVHDRRS